MFGNTSGISECLSEDYAKGTESAGPWDDGCLSLGDFTFSVGKDASKVPFSSRS